MLHNLQTTKISSAAARVTDGVMDKFGEFFHSYVDHRDPWLIIDLENAYAVHTIKILPRQEEQLYFRFANISVSENLYFEYPTIFRIQLECIFIHSTA